MANKKTCRCGKKIPPYKKGMSGPIKKWCSTGCKRIHRQLDVEAKKPKCQCGKPLEKNKSKWCSTGCCMDHYKSGLKEKRIKEKGKLTTRNCKYCGAFFMPAQRSSKVCQKKKCKNRYQSDATYKSPAAVRERQAIEERKVEKVCLNCADKFETSDLRRKSCGKKKCQEELERLYGQRDHIKIKTRLSARIRSALLAQRPTGIKQSTWDSYTVDEKAMGKAFSGRDRKELGLSSNYKGVGTGNYDRGGSNYTEKDCLSCGKEFLAYQNAKFCSDPCRKLKKQSQNYDYYQNNRTRLSSLRNGWRPKQVNCTRCGEEFTRKSSEGRESICSDECRKLNKKDRQAKEGYKERNRQIVRENKYHAKKHRRIMARVRAGEATKEDILYMTGRRLRTRVKCALKQQKTGLIKKHGTTYELLGCTIEEFREYFKSLFTRGMSWKKLLAAEIHIDHIRPCVSFDLTKESEQRKCFHYTNLQPLWAKDNLSKGAKVA